jgi:hypothetical protein
MVPYFGGTPRRLSTVAEGNASTSWSVLRRGGGVKGEGDKFEG